MHMLPWLSSSGGRCLRIIETDGQYRSACYCFLRGCREALSMNK
jgi:hypothetical protein